jgi:hypothetical protein
MYQNSGVRVDAYDVNGDDKTAYYGQIQEIWELDFHGFKIALFRCNWVDANRGVQKYKYGFISVNLSRHGYKTDPFVLAQHVAQVFYVSDTTNKSSRWLYLENGESSVLRMRSMRKSLIILMRYLLLPPQ